MTYRPCNRNEPTHEAPKVTKRWFDDRKPEQSRAHPFGFDQEPQS